MKKRVADFIAESIVQKGINTVFLLSGGGMMHLLDGLAANPDLEKIYHHHEQCAGIAAEAYARVCGGLGFCFATSGPGALNIVSSVAGAWLDSSPVVYITGQSKVSQTIRGSRIAGLRQFGTFEVDIIEIVKPITKYTWFLDKAADVPKVFEMACDMAVSGRPGPVLIDIPVDVQGAFFELDENRKYLQLIEKIVPDPFVFLEIVKRWKEAHRPLILAGHGVRVAQAGDSLKKISAATHTPILTTQLGKDIVEYENPYFIGHPGLKGDRPGNIAIQNADFVLCLGASLHVFTTGYELNNFAPHAFLVLVDRDRAILQREEVGVDLKCISDIASFLQCIESSDLMDAPPSSSTEKWRKKLIQYKDKYSVSQEPHKREAGRLNMYAVIDAAQRLSFGEETIVADAGSAFYTIGQAWRVKKNQRVLVSGGLGAMGWALPAATGASRANPASSVICITGDGSLHTNINELAVISHNRCNIKIIIFSNNGYLSIRNTQDNYFNGRYAGVDLNSGVFIPSIDRLAGSYQIEHHRTGELLEFERLFASALATDGPCIIEVLTNINQEIIPSVSSEKLENGQMVSMPLENMAPFLGQDIIDSIATELKS